jgi:hypothetical protein
VAEKTKAHLPVNDYAPPSFRVAFGTGERFGDGIANHYIGTQLLWRLRPRADAGNHRGEHGRASQRAVTLSRKLLA